MPEVWLGKNGIQQGPMAMAKARELVAHGLYGGHDLAWVVGTPTWVAIAEVPELTPNTPPDVPFGAGGQAPPPPPPWSAHRQARGPVRPGGLTPHAVQPRPWLRYFARSLDTALIGLVVKSTLIPALGGGAGLGMVTAGILTAAGVVAYESVCLQQYQTTLGKYLYGIEVRGSDGSPLNQSQSTNRALRVGLFGNALGIWGLAGLAQLVAYLALRSPEGATWDRQTGCTVLYREVSALQVLCATLLTSALSFYGIWRSIVAPVLSFGLW
jgi:hypothetical protein